MTEKSIIEKLNIKIIPSDKHEFLVSTKDLALGYGVKPHNIIYHKNNRPDEIKEGRHFISSDTAFKKEGLQWTRRGGIKLGMFIHSEIAKEFRNELENLAIRELEKDSDEQRLLIVEQMAILIKNEIKHKKEVKQLSNGQKQLAENQEEIIKAQHIYDEKLNALTDEFVDLTKPQRAEIRRKIKQFVDKFKYMFPNRTRNQLFASFGGILIDWFDVPKYDDIPQSRFVEAMNVLNCLEIATEERLIDLNGYVEVWKVRNLFSKMVFPQYNGNHQTTLDF